MEMSKTYQYRKVMKPMLERKRRARINKCLDELKDLMVESLAAQQSDSVARLEKADILELTVEHLKQLKQNKKSALESFRTGYVHAAKEVSKAMANLPTVDVHLGTKVMTHLGYRLNQIQANIQDAELQHNVNVYCESSYPPQMSPASSGYGSDSEQMTISATPSSSLKTKGLLKLKSAAAEIKTVWRPW